MKRKSKLLLLLSILLTLTTTSFAQGAGGDLLWSTSFNFLPGYNRVSAGTAFSSSTCIINGTAMDSSTGHSIGFIKVYDIDTGNFKWDRTLTDGDSNWFNVSLSGNLVYITGFSQSWPEFLGDVVFGVYDVNTGEVVWEATKENFYQGYLAINSVTPPTNYAVFVGGDESGNCVVEVYQAKGGPR